MLDDSLWWTKVGVVVIVDMQSVTSLSRALRLEGYATEAFLTFISLTSVHKIAIVGGGVGVDATALLFTEIDCVVLDDSLCWTNVGAVFIADIRSVLK